MDDKMMMTDYMTSYDGETRQSIYEDVDNNLHENDNKLECAEIAIKEMEIKLLRKLDPSYLNTISMSELFETVYKSKMPLIEGLLYPGTYLFVGSPKIGKSFLMAQIAYHISMGIPLWNYSVRKGVVLYLALEDDYRRLQERSYRMFGTDSTDRLYFSISVAPLGNGLDEQLTGFMQEHPDTILIIVDTLKKIRESSSDRYSYASDYDIITRLKRFADNYSICMLIVHHTRKQYADDIFDMISGTNGLFGAADGAFLLQKEKRTSNSATLYVAGRDQQDQKLYLTRNINKLVWEIEKVETELWKEPPEPILELVAQFITRERPDWCGSPTALVAELGADVKPNVLTMKLNINAGRLFTEYKIHYTNTRCHDGRKVRLHLEE